MKQKKKKRETQETLFIGLHNRRTDHLGLQREGGWVPLEAGYFLEAMELYRAWFRGHSLVFLYISDDPQWARQKILPRIKTKGKEHWKIFLEIEKTKILTPSCRWVDIPTWTPTPQGCLYLGPSPSYLHNSFFAGSLLTSYNFLA